MSDTPQRRRVVSAQQRPPARSAKPAPPPDSLAMSLLVAAQALAGVFDGHALNDGLASLWQRHPGLPPGTRAAVQDHLYGTLRDYGRGRRMLAQLLHTPLTDASVRALLYLALHRLEHHPQTAHTVVDQAVEAAGQLAGGNFRGLVNGVLRNALRQWPALMTACEQDEEAHWRHPRWWKDMLCAQMPNHWQSALSGGNAHPPMSLRINRRRVSRQAVETMLSEAGIGFRALSEWALQLERPIPVGQLPGYADGLLSVQDWGAQQAAMLLDLQEGQRVLDACAAPGGKTAHMLECASLDMMALDADPARAARVEAQLARLGLGATVKTADCRQTDSWWDGRPFERILADVPCSASGVARRHPDIKWLRRPADVANFATTQAQILEALWPLLAPGGKMLYVTCSVFARENGAQVARFAARHADCLRVAFDDGQFERQYLPDAEHDGFFFALLQKRT